MASEQTSKMFESWLTLMLSPGATDFRRTRQAAAGDDDLRVSRSAYSRNSGCTNRAEMQAAKETLAPKPAPKA